MSFAKFVNILDTKSLFFVRCNKLDDKFEGSITNRDYQKIEESKLTAKIADSNGIITEEAINKQYEFMRKLRREERSKHMASCWHMNQCESYSMWNNYSKGEGVCIQTTYKSLSDALPEYIHMGMIKYINYESDHLLFANDRMNSFDLVLHKRVEFSNENEVRAIFWDDGAASSLSKPQYINYILRGNEIGVPIAIDIKKIIENIYVDPRAEKWLSETVKKTCEKYCIDKPVRSSRLSDEPLF